MFETSGFGGKRVDMETIFRVMRHPDVVVCMEQRFSYILSNQLFPEGFMPEDYVVVGSNTPELLNSFYTKFMRITHENFVAIAKSPFYLQESKLLISGEKIVLPIAVPLGEYTYSVEESDKEGDISVNHIFKLLSKQQPSQIYWVSSVQHSGVSAFHNYINSEIGSVLDLYKELMLSLEREKEAKRLALNPVVLVQRIHRDPNATRQQLDSIIDARRIESIDMELSDPQKESIRVDNQGYGWLPDGYTTCSFQPKMDVSLIDTATEIKNFRRLVAKSMRLPESDDPESSNVKYKTLAVLSEIHSKLNSTLKAVCADLTQALSAVIKLIYGDAGNDMVNVTFQTRLPIEMLKLAHEMNIMSAEEIKQEVLEDIVVRSPKRHKISKDG